MTSTYKFRDIFAAMDYHDRAVREYKDLDFQVSSNRVSITGVDLDAARELAFYMGGDKE